MEPDIDAQLSRLSQHHVHTHVKVSSEIIQANHHHDDDDIYIYTYVDQCIYHHIMHTLYIIHSIN